MWAKSDINCQLKLFLCSERNQIWGNNKKRDARRRSKYVSKRVGKEKENEKEIASCFRLARWFYSSLIDFTRRVYGKQIEKWKAWKTCRIPQSKTPRKPWNPQTNKPKSRTIKAKSRYYKWNVRNVGIFRQYSKFKRGKGEFICSTTR